MVMRSRGIVQFGSLVVRYKSYVFIDSLQAELIFFFLRALNVLNNIHHPAGQLGLAIIFAS